MVACRNKRKRKHSYNECKGINSKNLIFQRDKRKLFVDESAYDFESKKTVVFVIGVNGVGKTTSIGKLAAQYKAQGKKVMMAAADTFRAAAIDQLKTWSNRAGVEIIAQNEGADPSAVVYDAVAAAKARNTDILLVDTAGRLHNKKNLMDELAKMRRIIDKEYPEANVESLIVLDGTTGQNALEQARQFSSVTEINGIIITKLDGTAKGGIVISIKKELEIPVKAKLDGEYVEKMSFLFDCKCFFGTIGSVLKSDGVVEGGTGELKKEASEEEKV